MDALTNAISKIEINEVSMPTKPRTIKVGVNTIQGTLRTPTYDIICTPPNPKFAIYPWNNPNIEPEFPN